MVRGWCRAHSVATTRFPIRVVGIAVAAVAGWRWWRYVMYKGWNSGSRPVVHRRIIRIIHNRSVRRIQGRRGYARWRDSSCMRWPAIRTRLHGAGHVGVAWSHVHRMMQMVDMVKRRRVVVASMVVVHYGCRLLLLVQHRGWDVRCGRKGGRWQGRDYGWCCRRSSCAACRMFVRTRSRVRLPRVAGVRTARA